MMQLAKWLHGSADGIAPQFVRYVFVGGASFVADAAVLAMATGLFRIHYLLGNAMGFLAGVALNYALSVRWVFSQRNFADRRWEMLLFMGVGGVGLLLNEGLMALFFGRIHCTLALSKVVTAALVLVWNFGARKALLFTAPKSCVCGSWKENEA